MCKSSAAPLVFDLGAPLPVVVRRRWPIVRSALVPLLLLCLALGAWRFGPPRAASRRTEPGAIPVDAITLAPARAGEPEWTAVPLPVDVPCTDLFLMVEAAVPRIDTAERTLRVQVSADGASWQHVPPARLWPGCAWWYRFTAPQPFTHARASVRAAEHGAPWSITRGLVLTRDAPAGTATPAIRELTAEGFGPGELQLRHRGSPVLLPTPYVDPGRCPASVWLVDPRSNVSLLLLGPDRVAVGGPGRYECIRAFDVPSAAVPGLDAAAMDWVRGPAYWSAMHSWHCPSVIEATGLPRSELGCLLLEDGRVAVVSGHEREPEILDGFDAMESGRTAGPELLAQIRQTIQPAFRRKTPWRPLTAKGDTFVILPADLGCVKGTPACAFQVDKEVNRIKSLTNPTNGVSVLKDAFPPVPLGLKAVTFYSTSSLRRAPPGVAAAPVQTPVARLAFLGTVEPDGTIQVRNARWGMSIAQVLKSEGAQPVTQQLGWELGDWRSFRLRMSGASFIAEYEFIRDHLIQVRFSLEPARKMANPAVCGPIFQALLAQLTTSYGKPSTEAMRAGGGEDYVWHGGDRSYLCLTVWRQGGKPSYVEIRVMEKQRMHFVNAPGG